MRRSAAKSLLDSLARLTDLAEVEDRIAELETAVGEPPDFPGEVAMRVARNGNVSFAADEEEEEEGQEEGEPATAEQKGDCKPCETAAN